MSLCKVSYFVKGALIRTRVRTTYLLPLRSVLEIFLFYKYCTCYYRLLRRGLLLHLFAFAFSPRIPQVVPQTRFTRLSIANKVRRRGQIVFTARTVTRRHAASSRINVVVVVVVTMRLDRSRDRRARAPFLVG